MAKQMLPVNYQDDIVSENMNSRRRFNMIHNPDGTYSFEDVTEYEQIGSNFGAGQINAITQAVNESADASKIVENLEDCSAITEDGFIASAKALGAINNKLAGCWIEFTDADGNSTDEPYIHWYEEVAD